MSKKRNYGGRRPLQEDKKKSEVLKVRLTKLEIEQIKSMHDKSYTKNFSELIRKILLDRAIKVDVCNTDVHRLSNEITELQSHCKKILRTKRKEIDQFKPTLQKVQETLSLVKMETDKLRQAELYLTDLRDISESEKKRYYPFYSW